MSEMASHGQALCCVIISEKENKDRVLIRMVNIIIIIIGDNTSTKSWLYVENVAYKSALENWKPTRNIYMAPFVKYKFYTLAQTLFQT